MSPETSPEISPFHLNGRSAVLHDRRTGFFERQSSVHLADRSAINALRSQRLTRLITEKRSLFLSGAILAHPMRLGARSAPSTRRDRSALADGDPMGSLVR